jgi:hypothetical protein
MLLVIDEFGAGALPCRVLGVGTIWCSGALPLSWGTYLVKLKLDSNEMLEFAQPR